VKPIADCDPTDLEAFDADVLSANIREGKHEPEVAEPFAQIARKV
jgi:hypothetical protein